MFNNKIKNIVFIQLFLYLSIFVLTQNPQLDEDVQRKKWDEKTLYQFVKNKYSNELKNLKYLIVDPNEYLKSDDLNESIQNFELLYKEFKVTFFLFVINSIKENSILNYQIRDLMYSINLEINKYNKNYEGDKIISILLAVDNNKKYIRVGSICRKILSDFEANKILKKINEDLNKNNLKNIINDLSKDILESYRNSFEMSKKRTIPLSLKLFFYIIIFILFCYIYYHFIKNNLSTNYSENFIKIETEHEKKLTNFINKNINKSIKKIMKDNCIICLGNYDGKVKSGHILYESEDSNNEKITLPCKHIFHSKCISQWFLKNNNCPLCNSEFEINNEDGKIIINNYSLNKDWNFNNLIEFRKIIKEFLQMHKNLNPSDINESFCNETIEFFDKNNYKNVKIENETFNISY